MSNSKAVTAEEFSKMIKTAIVEIGKLMHAGIDSKPMSMNDKEAVLREFVVVANQFKRDVFDKMHTAGMDEAVGDRVMANFRVPYVDMNIHFNKAIKHCFGQEKFDADVAKEAKKQIMAIVKKDFKDEFEKSIEQAIKDAAA